MRLAAALLIPIVVAFGCERAAAPPPAAQKAAPPATNPKEIDVDADNLLNVANGASVVSRTGEFDLEHSALHAIDGISTTRWVAPPGGGSQTMVFALPAPARIDRVGISTSGTASQVPSKVHFEVSADGQTWRALATFEPKAQTAPQIVRVSPADAMYLRFETIEPAKSDISLRSVHALGTETGTPQSQWFNGCWSVNGAPAAFVQNGARIQGVIGGDKPMALDGGTNSRVARFMWLRGPMWGYAALTMAPNGRTLSLLLFHQEALLGSVGAGWFGARCANPPARVTPAAPLEFLARAGRWSMFGLAFDPSDRLIEDSSRSTIEAAADIIRNNPSQKFRVVAHEFMETAAERSRARSAARIDAVRQALTARGVDVAKIDFIASGSEASQIESVFAIQRLIGSRIDLEIQR